MINLSVYNHAIFTPFILHSSLSPGMYKHGEAVGDTLQPRGDNSFTKIPLKSPIPLFSRKYNDIYVSVKT